MAQVSLSDLQFEADAAGFCLLGIRPPVQPSHYPAFSSWIIRGLHGGMDWIAQPHSIRLRADPSLLLPGSRSLVSLAAAYARPPSGAPSPGYGRVAAYACAADYHHTLPPRLKALAGKICEMSGKPARYRVFTDSAPLLERDLAQASGLGWIGKNTCLISPSLGSFFILAEILVDVDLPFTEPFEFDRCGSCRRCIEACPTGCIGPDRLIDARRCISYLTIEHDGPVPAEIRPKFGGMVFGCDICQSVCPWNRKSNARGESPLLSPVLLSPDLDLEKELWLAEDGFYRLYGDLPLRRSGLDRHLRNVIICAGNSMLDRFFPALQEVLISSSSSSLRSHAAWALGRISIPSARGALDAALKKETDPAVVDEIILALEAGKK